MAFEPTWCATDHSRTNPSIRLARMPPMTMAVEAKTRRWTVGSLMGIVEAASFTAVSRLFDLDS
jgi:hypothetical protein